MDYITSDGNAVHGNPNASNLNRNMISNASSIRRDEIIDRPLRRPTTPMTVLSSTSNSQIFNQERKSIASKMRSNLGKQTHLKVDIASDVAVSDDEINMNMNNNINNNINRDLNRDLNQELDDHRDVLSNDIGNEDDIDIVRDRDRDRNDINMRKMSGKKDDKMEKTNVSI